MNSSMIYERPVRGDIEVFEVPANDLVRQVGNDRLANIVMLGAYLAKTGLVCLEATEKAVEEVFKAKKGKAVVTQNRKALKVGHDYTM